MSNIKSILALFILFNLQTITKSEIEPIEIPINSHISSYDLNSENEYNKYFIINYTEEDLSSKNYLIISTYNSSYDKNAFIYTSFTEKNPSADKRDYLSQILGKNEIIINVAKLKGKSK